MTGLLRASTLVGGPVVTLNGESPFEVKDVVFDRASGELRGFTLRKKGILGSPVSDYLPWNAVHGLGPDAVMISDESALASDAGGDLEGGGDVLGNRVLTESGSDLGEVIEVVVSTGAHADVVGFEVEPVAAAHDTGGRNVFIPMPDTLAISGEKIIVPNSATEFIRDDLSGFGSAVADFRSALSGKDN